MLQDRSNVPIAFAIYLAYVLCFALAPFTFQWDRDFSTLQWLARRFEGLSSISRLTPWDIWTNMLFFLPFGWFLTRLPATVLLRPSAVIVLTFTCAALVSLAIEVAQTFLPRHPSPADVACNALGAVVGSALGLLSFPRRRDHATRLAHHSGPIGWIGIAMAGYWIALCLLFSLPLPLTPDFSNWDAGLRFHAGNETMLSQPWLGEFYGLRLYDRALSREEIERSFSAGPPQDPRGPHPERGLVVNYEFSEGSGSMVLDRAESQFRVDLRIEDPSLVRWLSPRGLAIRGSTGLSSLEGTAGSAHEKLVASGMMSLELWIKPAETSQPGPNPFVSSSDGIDLRNFALAQDAGDLVFWLRTPLTGLNGRKRELRTLNRPLTTELQYVVVTYESPTAVLYVNNAEQARVSLDKKQAVLDRIVDLIGPYYESGLQSVFVFPFGVLGHLTFGALKPAWLPFGAVTGLVAIIVIARVLLLQAQIDPSLIAVAAGTALIAGIVARHLDAGMRHSTPLGC